MTWGWAKLFRSFTCSYVIRYDVCLSTRNPKQLRDRSSWSSLKKQGETRERYRYFYIHNVIFVLLYKNWSEGKTVQFCVKYLHLYWRKLNCVQTKHILKVFFQSCKRKTLWNYLLKMSTCRNICVSGSCQQQLEQLQKELNFLEDDIKRVEVK